MSPLENVGVTMEALESRVQASREEIESVLRSTNVPLVPGTFPKRWCKLGETFAREVFDSVLSVIETRDWEPTASIPIQEVVSALEENYAAWVVEHVLRSYTTEGCESAAETVSLSVLATRIFRAEQILFESNGDTYASQLAAEWSNRLPKGTDVREEEVAEMAKVAKVAKVAGDGKDQSEEQQEEDKSELGFIALVRKEGLGMIDGKNKLVRKFSRKELSITPKIRFQQLFAARAEWRKDDLLSYLVGLDGGSTEKGAEILLVKWTRSGQGGAVFTKR